MVLIVVVLCIIARASLVTIFSLFFNMVYSENNASCLTRKRLQSLSCLQFFLCIKFLFMYKKIHTINEKIKRKRGGCFYCRPYVWGNLCTSVNRKQPTSSAFSV